MEPSFSKMIQPSSVFLSMLKLEGTMLSLVFAATLVLGREQVGKK